MADSNGNGIDDSLEPLIELMTQLGFYQGVPQATDTGSTSSTSKSYKQYDLQQVKGVAESAFQDAIGRAPSADELARFQASLNAAEKQSPSTTTGTSKSSVTSGGVDVQQFAKDTAELAPEYANYQKATTYFDSMISALRGPVGGGM